MGRTMTNDECRLKVSRRRIVMRPRWPYLFIFFTPKKTLNNEEKFLRRPHCRQLNRLERRPWNGAPASSAGAEKLGKNSVNPPASFRDERRTYKQFCAAHFSRSRGGRRVGAFLFVSRHEEKKEEERIRFFFLLETTEMRSVAALGRSSHYAAHRSFYFPDFHRRRRVFQYQKRISRNGLARRSAVALSGQRTFRWPLPLLLSFLDETPKKRQSRAKGERWRRQAIRFVGSVPI